jgi:inhibitor of KinA sporulation pathway (predicted exonuclease)
MIKHFKSYIKSSKNPRAPNISLDKIKDKIKDKGLIQKCSIKTGEELFQYIINLNKYYSSLEKSVFIEWGISDVSKIIDSINKNENKLFLSLYSKFEWIDRLIEHITLKKPFDSEKLKTLFEMIIN